MRRSRLVAAAALAIAACAEAAGACPVCSSPTGREVRAGIFGADFAANLLTAALPFPILLGAAAALHHGVGPRQGRDA